MTDGHSRTGRTRLAAAMLLFMMPHASACTLGARAAANALLAGHVHREEGFAPAPLVDELRHELHSLLAAGTFAVGTSHGSDGRRDGLRSALTCKPSMESAAFAGLFDRLDDYRSTLGPLLGREHATGMEATYVLYPPGGYYGRHLDSVQGVDAAGSGRRSVSWICYLSDPAVPWAATDGGALRVFGKAASAGASVDQWDDDEDEEGGQEMEEDILPTSGRLVLFDSKLVSHEVLPTSRQRACLVGWFLHAS